MITKEQATKLGRHDELHHKIIRNADGTPARVRVNGKCKVWKTRPHQFQLPVKQGLKNCFYLTEADAGDWLTEPITPDAQVHIRHETRQFGTFTGTIQLTSIDDKAKTVTGHDAGGNEHTFPMMSVVDIYPYGGPSLSMSCNIRDEEVKTVADQIRAGKVTATQAILNILNK